MPDDPSVSDLRAWLDEHARRDDQAMARLDERLRGITERLDEVLARHETRLNGHSEKIRSLELRWAGLAGGGGVLLVLVGYLMWAANFVWGKR